ncbi:4Fe-4S dicluster domain-containing protein [Meiothermus sp.]|jgi:molybdopterin-containing oxidoreductase family iron-sulfur binding subunit|uniref:4Fe-4S dicluster domain-containing protein n=1 Tax=Meiothermus sp. TaxID=1955249 RepID=UPI0021DCE332|nr:4Fe-4S dicluster domain-containing protein [Meiothermus sp.]GIW25073.1 MAG: 4Fe-4S ferredoxin [Meiothermus sp.]
MPENPSTQSTLDGLENRRAFLGKFASTVFAGMVMGGAAVRAEEVKKPLQLPTKTPDGPIQAELEYEDVLIRMQRELEAALQKGSTPKWVMVIDTRKCVGCHACTIACAVENKLPPGVVYRPVIEEQVGEYPNVSWRFTPRPCMQCDKPPCVPVCPVGATWKSEDGIVDIDYNACIGCRYCLTACPYQARTSDFGDHWTDGTPGAGQMPYEELPSFEYGREWKRENHQSPVGNARKCHFCRHRLQHGLLPQCVTSCIGRATFFGDANDPNSLVSQLIHKPNATRLKEELGTEPRVYYLV